MGRSWEEFEARAAEAAAAQVDEWGLSQQWGPPVRCVFLGPAAAGGAAGAAGGSKQSAERTPIGYQEKVRFRWTLSAPDAPADIALEEEVTAQANYVFMEDRGIPVPAAWKAALKFGAQVQQALARAKEEAPEHICTVHGLFRGAPAAAAAETATAARRAPGPRTGEKWVFREPNGGLAQVWVAAHHAADTWWCVKAPVPVWGRMAATCGAKSILICLTSVVIRFCSASFLFAVASSA